METVGIIDGYDVIYVPEKDIVFCKNTSVHFPVMERILRSDLDRSYISEKDLTITKDRELITLGCLTTTKENCNKIVSVIRRIKSKI